MTVISLGLFMSAMTTMGVMSSLVHLYVLTSSHVITSVLASSFPSKLQHITISYHSRHRNSISLARLFIEPVHDFTCSTLHDFTCSTLARHLLVYLSLDHRASTSFASTYCMITCASHSEASILFTPHSVRTIGYRQNFSLELNFL